jgi:hypothetical protein
MAEDGAFPAGHIPAREFYEYQIDLENIDRKSAFRPVAEVLKASVIKYGPPETRQDIDQGAHDEQ